MPALISKHQKKVLATQLKANFNLIAQALETSQANIEDPGWAADIDKRDSTTFTVEEKIALAEKYVTGHLKRTKIYGWIPPNINAYSNVFPMYKTMSGERTGPNSPTGTTYYTMELANGAFLFYHYDHNIDNTVTSPVIFVDVNGRKNPNIVGKDVFKFYINNSGKLVMPGYEKTREELLQICKNNASAVSIYGSCGALIQKDNWEIKDDYPW